ncbi:MAG: tRNA (N(6)-L-threonylcarbamoyladenosine(37)-C(2))-methylthiotransferase MtaB, partial [Candidatus Omnitrophota bacterium]
GKSRSRPLEEIVREAEKLVKNNYKEIVLCGICLGAYGKDLKGGSDLADVVTAFEKIKGLLRIRLSSIEALDVTDKLINRMRKSKKLCRHLHIPIQSGDDVILSKMNRKFSSGDYLKLIGKLKRIIPGIAITTDIMVGFPSERESNFKNTLALIKKIVPLRVHIFNYSKRGGTNACNFKGEVGTLIKKERARRLQTISEACSLQFRKRFLGQTMKVLFEKKEHGYWLGHTDNYINCRIQSGRDLKNMLSPVKLKKINSGYIDCDFPCQTKKRSVK